MEDVKYRKCDFSELQGLVLTEIVYSYNELLSRDEEPTVIFKSKDRKFIMAGDGDCCARAYLEDVCGDLQQLIGDPILLADGVANKMDQIGEKGWFFYKLSTIKESVTMRWMYRSSGYEGYSVKVSFEEELGL